MEGEGYSTDADDSEEDTEAADDISVTSEQELDLCPEPKVIARGSSIASRSYYNWRRHLWRNVNNYLKQGKTEQLMTYYDRHYGYWRRNGNHLDIALITLGRKGISAMFNLGVHRALTIMKNALREMEMLEEANLTINNMLFAKASVWCVVSMLYSKKYKLGRAWEYMAKALDALQNAEKCEFHADCAYTRADILLTRAAIGVGNNPGLSSKLKEQALSNAKLSRDICAMETDQGEWFALYAVESLFLYLRIYVEADLFGIRRILSLSEFQEERVWSEDETTHAEKTLKQVKTECKMLKYEYPYVKVGLVKCQCILQLQRARIERSKKRFITASDLCHNVLDICDTTLAQCEQFAGVMTRFVQHTRVQLAAMTGITRELKYQLDVLAEEDNRRLLRVMTVLEPDISLSDKTSDLEDLGDSNNSGNSSSFL